MSMLRFADEEAFRAFQKQTGVREARMITGKKAAAPARSAATPAVFPCTPGGDDDRRFVEHAPVAAAPKQESDIERRFAQQVRAKGLPPPEREYFHIAGRDFRLDFAWPAIMLGVEIQGMAHRIKAKFHADCEKRILAQMAGWTVLELSGDMVRHETGIAYVVEMINRRS